MDSNPGARVPISFAHRGARAQRRENTLEAFTLALALGASGLETDAWLTRDGVVVLDHDGTTGRFPGRRPIAETVRGDLAAHVPSLEDLYRTCGASFELSVDVKDPAALLPIIKIASASGDPRRLWLCHGDLRLLAQWRSSTRGARLVESTRLSHMRDGLPAHARVVAGAGVDALNLRGTEWSAERVAQVHAAGLLAFGWDAQTGSRMKALLTAGIDGIYSDHVDRLVRAIGAWGSEPAEVGQGPNPDEGPADDQPAGDRSDDP